MMKMIAPKAIGVVAIATLISACTADPYTGQQKVSNTVIGAGVGAGVGALGGLLIGRATGGKGRKGALIGAGVGALAGGGIGLYQDRQERRLREELQNSGVSVTRQGNNIILNMPSNITFGTDRADIKPEFFRVLNSVAKVLKEFNRSLVDVYGHTDSDGAADYNQQLSERRGTNVARYLVQQGINGRRFYVVGYGEERPVASNASAAGKAQNRRVEIQIAPLT